MKLVSKIIIKQKLCLLKSKWRKKNVHNSTELISIVPIENVVVGNGSYGNIRVITYNEFSKLVIGDFCSVGEEVTFLLDAEHNVNTISTFPFKVAIVKMGKNESFSKGDIIVDDDVWIGYGATILSGVHIGQGAVVAAGAVVTKDVPPYAVVGGVPAKVIKYRFEQPVIDYMLTLNYSALTEDLIREHVGDLYTEIDGLELEEVKKLFAWFPKKCQSVIE